ncbi:MAG TPA: glycosyltransferase [Clostridiales bacterium]|nr:glycosyltransferase [Clostridiales bacterium]
MSEVEDSKTLGSPLVSVIIRTCGRPHILKNAIESVVNQDYANIEIVVVEDGSSTSEHVVRECCKKVSFQYYHTAEKVGRTVVGNLGLQRAKGEYFNFLDDDDILFHQHIDVLVSEAVKHNKLVVYAIAEEHQIKEGGKTSYPYKVKRKLVKFAQQYNKLLLCYKNYLPIQSVIFHRSLFEQYGGFDESLDYMEDWDMWVRYSSVCDFFFVPQITSIYYTPYKNRKKQERDILMKEARRKIILKHSNYDVHINAEQINNDMEYILNVYTKTGLFFYMKKIRDLLLYKDT